MATGVIKRLNEKGYGFIAEDGNSHADDLFFHRSALKNGQFEELTPGVRVSFHRERRP